MFNYHKIRSPTQNSFLTQARSGQVIKVNVAHKVNGDL